MVEYLGLADYLLIAEAVLDVPAEVLALSTNLHLADSALNAPAASFAGTELYTAFSQKAATASTFSFTARRNPPRWL